MWSDLAKSYFFARDEDDFAIYVGGFVYCAYSSGKYTVYFHLFLWKAMNKHTQGSIYRSNQQDLNELRLSGDAIKVKQQNFVVILVLNVLLHTVQNFARTKENMGEKCGGGRT